MILFLTLLIIFGIFNLYMIRRIDWVFEQRIKLIYKDIDLDKYLNFGQMVCMFWVYDMNKLRKKS